MPPLASWFGPRDAGSRTSSRRYPMSGQILAWKMAITTANGQPAFGAYAWDPSSRRTGRSRSTCSTFRGDRISDVVAFAVRDDRRAERRGYHRWDTAGHGRTRLRENARSSASGCLTGSATLVARPTPSSLAS